jgi:AcrR family transcriptional regulator
MRRNTKDLLMEKGEILLSQRDYYDTKVEDITKEAGVAKGTFYIYFESKEEIFMEIIHKKIKEQIENVNKISKEDINFEEKLFKFTAAFITLMVNNMGIFRSFFKISQIDNGSISEKIHKLMIESHNRMIGNKIEFFNEAFLKGEINERYKNNIKDLAVMYETMRSEYIIRKLIHISCENEGKDISCNIFNKFGEINTTMNEKEIEIEAKFITDIFLGGIKK